MTVKSPAQTRMLQAQRESAIARLQDHYAREHIDVEEFESLVEHAEYARDDAELNKLFDGLPEIDSRAIVSTSPPEVIAPSSDQSIVVAELVKPTSIVTVFASTSRKGNWTLPRMLNVRAVFGSVELDLSQMNLSSGESVIHCVAVFGSVTVIVPEGLAVICEGNAVLGSFDHVMLDSESKRDRRSVRIVGQAVLGSVDVIQRRRQKNGGELLQIGEQIGAGLRALLGGRR